MSRDFDRCLKQKRIVAQEFVEDLVEPELEIAKSDLARAKKTYDEEDYK